MGSEGSAAGGGVIGGALGSAAGSTGGMAAGNAGGASAGNAGGSRGGTSTLTVRQKLYGWKKTGIFALALLLSFFLWFMVNMGREYSVTLELPIEVRNISEEIAISGELPELATVNVSGEGWALLNYYNNPPKVTLDGTQQQVNMLEEVRSLFGNASNISVKQVNPSIATIQTEKKRSVTVPVRSRVSISMRERYGMLSEPVLSPDSVTITGAVSQVESVTEWQTEDAELVNLDETVSLIVSLVEPETGLLLSVPQVDFYVPVAEFTEAEVRVPVQIRNLPPGKVIEINPAMVSIRFDIPIEEYSLLQNQPPFAAFVEYTEILQDESGLVMPQVEPLSEALHARFKSVLPSRVSYYHVIPQ